MKNRSTIAYILGGFAGLVFLWLATRNLNFNAFKKAILHADIMALFFMVICIIGFFGIKGVKWKALLNPVKSFPIYTLFPSMMVGAAANYLLQPYIGELVRTYYLSVQFQIRKSAILATIILERVLDVISILLLVGFACLFSPTIPREISTVGYIFSIAGLTSLLLIYLITLNTERFLDFAQRIFNFFPQRYHQNLMDRTRQTITGLSSIQSPIQLLKLMLISLIQWGVMGLAHYFSIIAIVDGVPFSSAILIMGLIACGIIVMSTPGQIGLMEFCYVLGLKGFGIPAADAFASAILYHVLLYVIVILFAFLYLKKTGISFKQLTQNAQTEGGDG